MDIMTEPYYLAKAVADYLHGELHGMARDLCDDSDDAEAIAAHLLCNSGDITSAYDIQARGLLSLRLTVAWPAYYVDRGAYTRDGLAFPYVEVHPLNRSDATDADIEATSQAVSIATSHFAEAIRSTVDRLERFTRHVTLGTNPYDYESAAQPEEA